MVTERTCNSCAEEANLFCRICNTATCWDHMCSHLQVAHSDNSYTQRLGDEIYDDRRSGAFSRDDENEIRSVSPRTNILPADKQSICSYTQEELQTAYDYHRAETRRIRAELERRALFASGVVPTEHLSSSYYEKELRRKPVQQRRRVLPLGVSRSVEILAGQIRLGNISVEYVKHKLQHYSK